MTARSARVLRGGFLAAVGLLAAGGASVSFQHGNLARELAGASFIERGRIGADEWRNVLNRAGRLEVRRLCAEAARLGVLDRQVSGLADAWAAVVEAGTRLPQAARVYLDVPSSVIYYDATTLWYPRRVDVGRTDAVIKDDETLRAAHEPIGPGRYAEIRGRGYTHLVRAEGNRLVVVDLRAIDGADRR